MFCKHKGPEATKCYIQLIKSYNQQAVMFSNIIYSQTKHESCRDLFPLLGKGMKIKQKSHSNPHQILCLQHIIKKS